MNGEALWEWRKLHIPSKLLDTLQDNSSRVAGYRFLSSSRTRVGSDVYNRVEYITKKVCDTNITSHRHRALRSLNWCSIALHPNEITDGPAEVINELKKNKELLIQENQRLKN